VIQLVHVVNRCGSAGQAWTAEEALEETENDDGGNVVNRGDYDGHDGEGDEGIEVWWISSDCWHFADGSKHHGPNCVSEHVNLDVSHQQELHTIWVAERTTSSPIELDKLRQQRHRISAS
jgi:hypothetical protein